jgi:hypothetical protein
MNLEIQTTTEQRFDLSMSVPITMTSLWDQLGSLSDTDFTMQMLRGELHIPPDVDATTTLVLEEIVRLFGTLEDGHTEITLGILNDISNGIDKAAALMKRGRNMIWSGMAYGNIILDLSWSWIQDKSRLNPGRIYRRMSVLDPGRPESKTDYQIQDGLTIFLGYDVRRRHHHFGHRR